MAPPVLAAFAVGSSLVGAGVSFIGQQQSASTNARIARQNADIQRQAGLRQESLVRRETEMQADATARDRARRLSALRAAVGSSGARFSGSILDLIGDDSAEAQRDLFNIRYSGLVRAQDARFNADLAERRERINLSNARSGRITAFGSLLGAASGIIPDMEQFT
jgi:hypothetical protein